MLFTLYSVEIPNRASGGKGDKTSNEHYFIQIWKVQASRYQWY